MFLLVFAGLQAWGAVGGPPLLSDATRHVFTVGVVTLMLFGFAGRMVPGFSGGVLRWVPAYDKSRRSRYGGRDRLTRRSQDAG